MRPWHAIKRGLGLASDTASDSADAANAQAAGLRNRAGQCWDDATRAARESWEVRGAAAAAAVHALHALLPGSAIYKQCSASGGCGGWQSKERALRDS